VRPPQQRHTPHFHSGIQTCRNGPLLRRIKKTALRFMTASQQQSGSNKAPQTPLPPILATTKATRRQLLSQSSLSIDATLPFPHHVAHVSDRSSDPSGFPARETLQRHAVEDCLLLSETRPPKQPFHLLTREFPSPTLATTHGLASSQDIETRLRYETSSQRSQRVGLWGSASTSTPAPTVRSLSVDTNHFAAGRCSRVVRK